MFEDSFVEVSDTTTTDNATTDTTTTDTTTTHATDWLRAWASRDWLRYITNPPHTKFVKFWLHELTACLDPTKAGFLQENQKVSLQPG